MTTPPDRHAKSDPHPTASPHPGGDAALPSDAGRAADPGPARRLEPGDRRLRGAIRQETARSIKQENELLRQELERYRRYVFGRRSERLDDPGQGHLFELDEDRRETAPRRRRRHPGGRRPRGSPGGRGSRISIACPRSASSTTCPRPRRPAPAAASSRHASARTSPACSSSSRPASSSDVHVLPKYACPHCRDGVASPPDRPPRPVSGCIAGPALLCLRGRHQVRRPPAALSIRRYLDASWL